MQAHTTGYIDLPVYIDHSVGWKINPKMHVWQSREAVCRVLRCPVPLYHSVVHCFPVASVVSSSRYAICTASCKAPDRSQKTQEQTSHAAEVHEQRRQPARSKVKVHAASPNNRWSWFGCLRPWGVPGLHFSSDNDMICGEGWGVKHRILCMPRNNI